MPTKKTPSKPAKKSAANNGNATPPEAPAISNGSQSIVLSNKVAMSSRMTKPGGVNPSISGEEGSSATDVPGVPAVEGNTKDQTLLGTNKPRLKVTPTAEAAKTAAPTQDTTDDKDVKNDEPENKKAKTASKQEPTKESNTDTGDVEPEVEDPEQGGDEAIVDELAKQAANRKKHSEQAKIDDAQHQKIQGLISSREYNVPVKQLSRRRFRFIVTLLLLIVLLVVVFNFAIDAELIDVGIQPITNLL